MLARPRNNLHRRVITTVVGSGKEGFGGDGGPAIDAQLWSPEGIAVDAGDKLYVSDTLNDRIRKASDGMITSIAGNGSTGFGGDNGLAIDAQLSSAAQTIRLTPFAPVIFSMNGQGTGHRERCVGAGSG
jgi:hypothetical protein